MASYIVLCNSNCLGSKNPCGEPACPTGYYCDSRDASAEPTADSTSETACVTGLCINQEDDSVSDTPCQTCAAGSVIVAWKDIYKTRSGKNDCEFIEEECPQFCINSECADPGGESDCTGCDTGSKEYDCPAAGPGQMPTTITVTPAEKNVCYIGPDGYGTPDEDLGKKVRKGLVAGQERLNCCGCDSNPGSCPTYTAPPCCTQYAFIPSWCQGCYT